MTVRVAEQALRCGGDKPVEEDWVPAVGFSELRPVSQAVSPQPLIVSEEPLVLFTVLQISP